ncbi:hypothetical protein HQ609_05170 [Rhodococcus corynebacterioides]|nr:hypothetical protein [Rhodococcus corynebacterioides]
MEAQAWLCALPLPVPLNLGAISYKTRDYVVLRLTTSDGYTGHAVGYTRGTPLLEASKVVCEHLADLPTAPEAAHTALRKRLAPGWGAFARAASLVDIALWDIRAQRQGRPLAATLGARTADAPLMAVAGYFSDTRSVDELVEETIRFVEDGYTTLKLILPGHDRRADLHLLDTMRAAHPDRIAIAVDFHGAFDSVSDALGYCEDIHRRGVRFIEDPFPSLDWHNVADFASQSPSPVASGEDLVNLTGFDDLLGAGVQYLRVDVTASGGYTTALAALQAAEQRSARVAPHVWPHFHAPLVAASPSVAMIEVIPDHVGADPLWRLLSEPAPIHAGTWLTPTEPGLALPLDMEAVAHHSVDSWSSSARPAAAPIPTGGVS